VRQSGEAPARDGHISRQGSAEARERGAGPRSRQYHERELCEQTAQAWRRLVKDWRPQPKKSGAGATRGRAFSSHLLGEETAARQGSAPEPAL
jgi:hypothetical protein